MGSAAFLKFRASQVALLVKNLSATAGERLSFNLWVRKIP